jgi:transposase-like protein
VSEQELFEKLAGMPKAVIDFIRDLIASLKTKNDEIEALRAENRKLKEQLSLNSHNSSLPPSSDRPGNKPQPKSLKKPSGKKRGGQVGHKGHGIKHLQTRTPDKTVVHWPGACEGCSQQELCAAAGRTVNPQYEYDVLLIPHITRHTVGECVCPLRNGEVLKGIAPLPSTHVYGNGLMAMCALLYTYGTVSYGRIKELIKGFFGFSISEATIYSAVKRCSEGLDSTMEWIKIQLIKSAQVFFDETGSNVNGKNHWVHTATNGDLVHLSVQEKRGFEGMIKAGILPEFDGIGLHDYWQSYYHFVNMVHTLCNAHLLRELIERWENTGQEWAEKMIKLLLEIKLAKEKIIEAGGTAFSKDEWTKHKSDYDKIVQQGLDINPIPPPVPGKRGKPKRGKTRCLLDRLHQRHEEILRFATDFSVPFDNNAAERMQRHVKNRQKISGCMRIIEGAQAYCDIMSYLLSTRNHNVNAFDAILRVFNGSSRALVEGIWPGTN